MMESENVIVVVRIRPIQKSEELRGEKGCVAPTSSGKEVQVRTGPLAAQVFKCNGCFPRDTSQEEFFDQSGITDLLDSAMGGYRASTFAFGQTGAGKTFTCSGPSDDGISPGHPDEGLLGRSLKYLFEKLSDLHVKFNLRISCYEIYHENVFDLFAEEKERTPLGVREHSTDGFFLVGCKLINCPSYKVACNAVGYAIQNRQVGHHDLNSHSSRSHCITEIYIDLPGQAALMSTAGARAPGLKGGDEFPVPLLELRISHLLLLHVDNPHLIASPKTCVRWVLRMKFHMQEQEVRYSELKQRDREFISTFKTRFDCQTVK